MNSFGRLFRVSIFGESHGKSIGVVIDGCPCGIPLAEADFLKDIERRKAGSLGTTSRIEKDEPHILSGVFQGKTTGAPVTVIFQNNDTISSDYELFKEIPRPGHADYTSLVKYKGFADMRGSGHFSGRLTAALVAAGVVAKKVVGQIEINAKLIEAGGNSDIEEAAAQAEASGDSIGGIIECSIKNVPAGLGEPFFDSAESVISHIVFAVPGIRGIEFGTGFAASKMSGSKHNDCFTGSNGETATNNHAGINGGITNSNPIFFKVAVKPTSTINIPQTTYNFKAGRIDQLKAPGRHDLCFALRLPPVIEAASAIALADLLLIFNAYK